MTKPAAKPCACCAYFDNGIPCKKGHKPRNYADGRGYARVCKDFKTEPDALTFIERLKAMFGIS